MTATARETTTTRLVSRLQRTRLGACVHAALLRGCAYAARRGLVVSPSVLFACVSSALLPLLYLLTSHRVVLTALPHKRGNRHFSYPCDYLVTTNRLTGTTRVYDVSSSNSSSSNNDDDDTDNVMTRRKRAPRAYRVVRVNWLLHASRLYAQKTRSSLCLDLHDDLAPDRFVDDAYKCDQRRAATTTAVDAMTTTTTTTTRSSSSNATSATHDTSSPPSPSVWLCIDSTVRPRAYGRHAHGVRRVQYELLVEQTVREAFAQRYRAYLLRHRIDAHTPHGYAHELLRNGQVDGRGVTARDVVPDLDAWQRELYAQLQGRVDQCALLYDFRLRWATTQ